MVMSGTPGVVANPRRKNGAVRDVRRMTNLERAADFLGHAALADALGMGSRLLRQKIAAERPIHDEELSIAARAVSVRSSQGEELAERLTALIGSGAAA
jgi:hypothetical protein